MMKNVEVIGVDHGWSYIKIVIADAVLAKVKAKGYEILARVLLRNWGWV